MNKRVVYSAATSAIYSTLYYVLIESPDGVGILNSPVATLNYGSLLQLSILYPIAYYTIFLGLIYIGSFAEPILKILHIDTEEVGRAITIHIPVAILLGILAMAFGIKIIGEMVI